MDATKPKWVVDRQNFRLILLMFADIFLIVFPGEAIRTFLFGIYLFAENLLTASKFKDNLSLTHACHFHPNSHS